MAELEPHLLVLSALGTDRPGMLSGLTNCCFQCGCNILNAQMRILEEEFCMTLLLSGSWSVIAKMEAMLPGLEQKLGITTMVRRTAQKEISTNVLSYTVQIIALDRPGILQELSDFFSSQQVNIQELQSDSTPTLRSSAPMLSVSMLIDIPETMHLAGLRERFMIYCEDRNLDAVLEPQKSW
jgi:glycine cleavage system transcriptional repressor